MTRPSAFTWAEERYAAGEALAKAARAARVLLPDDLTATPSTRRAGAALDAALVEYDRTRDHP